MSVSRYVATLGFCGIQHVSISILWDIAPTPERTGCARCVQRQPPNVSPLASVQGSFYDAGSLGHWGVGEKHGDTGRFLVSHAGAVRPYRRPGPRLLCPLLSPARSGALRLLGGAGVQR